MQIQFDGTDPNGQTSSQETVGQTVPEGNTEHNDDDQQKRS